MPELPAEPAGASPPSGRTALIKSRRDGRWSDGGRSSGAPTMARPTWKGHISFGLVHIPVSLYTADQRTDISFHLLDSRDSARVRYQRVNEHSGEEVPWDSIVKGYEFSDGN